MYLTHLLWMNCKHSKQCNIYKDLHEDLRVSVVVIASSLRKASCRRAFATHPPSEKALSTVEVRRLHCWAYIPPSWINSIFAPLRASISCYERGRLVLISSMTMRGGPFDFWLGGGWLISCKHTCTKNNSCTFSSGQFPSVRILM